MNTRNTWYADCCKHPSYYGTSKIADIEYVHSLHVLCVSIKFSGSLVMTSVNKF